MTRIEEKGKIAGIKFLKDANPLMNINLRALKEMVEKVIADEKLNY